MRRRLFTAEEQARSDARVRDVTQAFMWTPRIPLGARMLEASKSFARYGVPILLAAVLSAGIASWMMGGTSLACSAASSGLTCIVVLGVAFLAYMTVRTERASARPPAFLFFDDKLYHIEQSEGSSALEIPRISSGELTVLRNESGKALSGSSNMRIEAECHYISCVRELEIGNETPVLSITVIENIVDVYPDEGDEGAFVIAYEGEYGDEEELRLPMREWRELYDWLYQQIIDD